MVFFTLPVSMNLPPKLRLDLPDLLVCKTVCFYNLQTSKSREDFIMTWWSL